MTLDTSRPGAPPTPPDDALLEQRRWHHWFFLLGVAVLSLIGLVLVVAILIQSRASGPWPWQGSEFVLLIGLLLAVFLFGGYLTYQERVVAELRRRLARSRQEALRESEERFRQLAENIDDCFWIKDADSDSLLYLSPAFDKIWERDRDSFYEGRVRWIDTVHAEDRRRVVKIIAGRTVRRGYDEEYRIMRPDGEVRWVRDRGFPVRDDRGVVFRVAGLVHDITDEKTLRASLHQSQKMEALGQLAGGVAHDFNNLLTVILGRADILARRNRNSALDRDVELIGRTARQAAGLTRQLLAMSRKQVLAPQVINLNDVVRHIEDVLRRLVGESIDLVTNLDAGLGTVKADRGQIEQVILNLAINARDAMLRGGRLVIETGNGVLESSEENGSADPGPCVVLSVSDTGCGIDETTLAHIFEPFFTTKETGTGLGLATVYGIVKQSGGEIRVQSVPREGTTFRIYLPQVEATARRTTDSGFIAKLPTGHETVLVVEDQADVRELTCEILHEAGYRVLEAGEAAEALDLARKSETPLDLILCDVMLRGANGFELSSDLREAGRCSRVLYMSGHAGKGVLPEAIEKEQLHFLQKPFRPQDLLGRVREVLESPAIDLAA